MVPAEPNRAVQPHPLISTKLEPPARSKAFIGHRDLLQKLTARRSPLLLLVAPAGWGKSSALAAWSNAEDEDRTIALVRLDEEDDEPRAFWSYVVAAIYGLGQEPPAAIAGALTAPGGDSLHAIAPSLINDLDRIDQEIVLALDDYHLITDPVIHLSIEYLIERAPPNLQIALASRSEPSLPIPRWRASGILNELRLNDLRMSADDATELLATRFGLAIDRPDAELLCQRTEGWPAGIQLAGVSMTTDPDPSAFIKAFAGNDRNVADYLTNEVLRRQPDDRARFLLETSILDALSAELCDDVLETTGSAEMLEAIERENLFLLPLDSTRHWFRYHHQFQEWLLHTLRVTGDESRLTALHARAAAWHLEHGSEDRSVDHHLAAGDAEAAAAIIDRQLARLAIVHEGPVRHWLPAIPPRVAAHHPRICIAQLARCLSRASYDEANDWLSTLDASIAGLGEDARARLDPHINIYRGLYALPMLDLEVAASSFRSVVENGNNQASIPSAYARGLLGLTLFWLSGPADALPHLQEGAADRQRLALGDTGITAYLAAAHAELGEWGRCEATLVTAFARPTMPWSRYPETMPAHYANARLLHHRGRQAEALDAAELGLAQAKNWPAPAFTAWGHLVLSDIAAAPADKRHHLLEAELHASSYRATHHLRTTIARAKERLDSTSPVTTPTGAVAEELTRRELDVLRLYRSDLTLRGIGNELDITLNTAKGYAKSIYRKLGVNSRPGAVAAATEAGMI